MNGKGVALPPASACRLCTVRPLAAVGFTTLSPPADQKGAAVQFAIST
jgi:hypothetical protein